MIYSPHSLLDLVRNGKIITNLSDRELNSPEGVGFDLRLSSLSSVGSGSGSLRTSTRRTPQNELLDADANSCFALDSGKTYLATTIEEFDLPPDMAAIFFPRSIKVSDPLLQISPAMYESEAMKPIFVLVVVTLTGCASNSGIVQMGSNTYMVSRQAATGFTGMGTLKAEAMKEAFDQCQKTGKAVEVIETIDAKPPYIFGNFPKTEIRFKCVIE